MKVDVTSMFFNSKIEGQTATPAWGTSIGQSIGRQCRIDDFKEGVVNLLVGMTYKSITDYDNLDLTKGSKDTETLICAVFNDIFINGQAINDTQFTLLLIREHSKSHDGRLIIKYAPYIKYNNYSNQECINKLRDAIGCSEKGCWFVHDIQIINQSELHFSAVVVNPDKEMIYPSNYTSHERSTEWKTLIPAEDILSSKVVKNTDISIHNALQTIFYGAPGTGKSFAIKQQTSKESVIRTTFHPDSDYSTFVGAYKPTTNEVVLRDLSGHKVEEDGKTLTESKIVYEFVNQAFLQAYIKAWEFYAEAEEETDVKKQFLVIEEINRGNCAQIFGDLFQLLDRNDYGFSDYPIQADADMKKQLKKAFKDLNIAFSDSINAMYTDRENTIQDVLNGDILLLPNNLYIWATMNTSDQSLFPIDSAFKRRWDWKYMPIYNANQEYKIQIGDNFYDWWMFLQRINALIGGTTSSEDKKLGYFFCKAKDKIISAETFVGKVIFYLWNDVFKDYEFANEVFDDIDGNKLTFDKFYTTDEKGNSTIINDKVELFFKNLDLKAINAEVEEITE